MAEKSIGSLILQIKTSGEEETLRKLQRKIDNFGKKLSKEERLQIVKECSLEGSEYCKKLRTLTDKVINNLE